MADLCDKTLGPVSEGKAQASLAQLRQMRSVKLEVDGNRVVRWSLLASREVWKRVSGTGEKAVYQLEQEQREDT